ncbi:MAG: L-serine ammonia-lyase [Phycisphaerales bacterium]
MSTSSAAGSSSRSVPLIGAPVVVRVKDDPSPREKPVETISVFDIFKIGVGPSSSHTMGPWRAAQRFLDALERLDHFNHTLRVRTDLYGSLAKTGIGHGTDVAVMLGLAGEDPETCDTAGLMDRVDAMKQAGVLRLRGVRKTAFAYGTDIVFHKSEALPFHPNALRFTAELDCGETHSETYYSVGGGFVVQEPSSGPGGAGAREAQPPPPPMLIDHGDELQAHCDRLKATIPEVVLRNELTWRSEEAVRAGLLKIWRVMEACILLGCHTEGVLPGGLNVVRRAAGLNERLLGPITGVPELQAWKRSIRDRRWTFQDTLKWVSAFALAVNEENASFGRVVTAPTNGAAGVIPAVMMYDHLFNGPSDGDSLARRSSEQRTIDFMLTAGELGSLFKKGATISAAMGGCQAEIGVSSAMAAGGLAQVLGGTAAQVLMAAEIAMEHHLGMTCDPIGGLVQVPCIERNTMGAIKAITAAQIALEGDPSKARVSLDGVIKTMWETAKDMGTKYKETAEGGLAVNVPVGLPEC